MRYFICFSAVLFMLTACGNLPEAQPPKDIPQVQIASDNTNWTFALNYYSQVNQVDRNIVFSPFGLQTTFATLYLGAGLETANEIAQVFHFDSKAQANLLESAQISKSLGAIQGLNLANSLWIQNSLGISPVFLEQLQVLPGFKFEEVNFQEDSPSVRYAINQWVEKSSGGKIQVLVGDREVNETTQLVTANVISLDAKWASPFHISDTLNESFFAYGDTLMELPMMHQKGDFPFFRGDKFSILQLPYSDQRLSLNIILPHEMEGLYGIESELNSNDLKMFLEELSLKRVEIALPRFVIESGGSVQEELQAMGLNIPFTSQANFSNITQTADLSLSTVAQRVQIDVYEEGTFATGATEASMRLKAVPPTEQEEVAELFRTDHPFFFFILDSQTKEMLFVGRFEVLQEKEDDKSSNS